VGEDEGEVAFYRVHLLSTEPISVVTQLKKAL
jgi:hypothetical protein